MFCVKTTVTLVKKPKITFVLRSLATQANVKLQNEETSQTSMQDQEWLNAKPFSEIPRPPILSFISAYFPGGKYHNKSSTDIALMVKNELGELNILPGLFGKSDILMVYNPDHIAKIYRTEGQWPHRSGFETVAYYREVLKKDFFGDTIGLVAAQGERWGQQRSTVNPVIVQPRNVKLYINSLIDVNDEFIERIRELRDPVTKEVPGNFEEDLNRLTFESITSVALNKSFGLIRRQKENPEALQLFKSVRDFFINIFEVEMKPSLWKICRTPAFNRMMKCQEDIFQITSKFVSDAMAELEAKKSTEKNTNNEPSVLEKLLKIDEKFAVVMTMDMLLAGVDATSTVLTGALLTLAKHPEKQEILRQEILKIMPTKDTPLTVESMKNMPYLRACIKESMRYYPIAAGSFRSVGKDIVLNGYQIPKGTTAILNTFHMLSDDNYYTRAKEFVPERWLRRNESHEVIHDNSHPFSFVPFGFGPRICVGKRIVDIELELCLTKIVRNFRVEFNHPAENAFRQYFINIPDIPLRFKFTDLE